MPKCSKCGIDRPDSDYRKSGNGLSKKCKHCCRIYDAEYRAKNKAIGKKYYISKKSVELPKPFTPVAPWPEVVSMGNVVTIEWDKEARGRNIGVDTFSGTVVWMDNRKALLQGKHYKRTLDRIDLHIKAVRIVC